MGETNLYLIKFEYFNKSSEGQEYQSDDKRTVVSDGDALAAIKKLREVVIGEVWEDDEDDDGKKRQKPIKWTTTDVKIHHVERVSEIDIL